jgi:hypothetical protein
MSAFYNPSSSADLKDGAARINFLHHYNKKFGVAMHPIDYSAPGLVFLPLDAATNAFKGTLGQLGFQDDTRGTTRGKSASITPDVTAFLQRAGDEAAKFGHTAWRDSMLGGRADARLTVERACLGGGALRSQPVPPSYPHPNELRAETGSVVVPPPLLRRRPPTPHSEQLDPRPGRSIRTILGDKEGLILNRTDRTAHLDGLWRVLIHETSEVSLMRPLDFHVVPSTKRKRCDRSVDGKAQRKDRTKAWEQQKLLDRGAEAAAKKTHFDTKLLLQKIVSDQSHRTRRAREIAQIDKRRAAKGASASSKESSRVLKQESRDKEHARAQRIHRNGAFEDSHRAEESRQLHREDEQHKEERGQKSHRHAARHEIGESMRRHDHGGAPGKGLLLAQRDEVILCRQCHQTFPFTVGEQLFYAKKELKQHPTSCKPCREARKVSARR